MATPETFWHDGYKAKLTGNSDVYCGGTFREAIYLDGCRKGRTFWTDRTDDRIGNPKTEQTQCQASH